VGLFGFVALGFNPAQPQNADPVLRGRRYAKLAHYLSPLRIGAPSRQVLSLSSATYTNICGMIMMKSLVWQESDKGVVENGILQQGWK
jgi:hypothetical protein